jgi:hypothetical protein
LNLCHENECCKYAQVWQKITIVVVVAIAQVMSKLDNADHNGHIRGYMHCSFCWATLTTETNQTGCINNPTPIDTWGAFQKE